MVFNLILIILAFVILGVGALIGARRGWLRALIRTVTLALAFVAAWLVTPAVTNSFSEALEELGNGLLNGAMAEGVGEELTNASPSLTSALAGLPAAAVAPFVFAVLFIVFALLALIVYAIVARICKKAPKKGKGVGAAIGLIAGVVVLCSVYMPLAGYAALLPEVIEAADTLEEADKVEISGLAADAAEPVSANFVLKATGALTNRLLFDRLTVFSVKEEETTVGKELGYVAVTVRDLSPLFEEDVDVTYLTEEQANAVRAVAGGLENSVIAPRVAGEIIPTMAEKWIEGKEFMGAEDPLAEIGDDVRPLIDDIFAFLRTTDRTTVSSDVKTVAEVFARISSSGAIAQLTDDDLPGAIRTAAQKGFLSGLVDTLAENRRTRTLIAPTANLGFTMLGRSLSLPEDKEALYGGLLDSLTTRVMDALYGEGSVPPVMRLSFDLYKLFGQYGIACAREDCNMLAAFLCGKYAEANYDTIRTDLSGAFAAYSAAIYAGEAEKDADPITAGRAADLADMLSSPAKLVQMRATVDDLTVTKAALEATADEKLHKEALAMEEVFAAIAGAVEESASGVISCDLDKMDTVALSRALVAIRGEEAAIPHGLSAAMQAATAGILQNTGMDAAAAENLLQYIADTTPEGDDGASDTLVTAITVVTVLQSDDITKKDIREAVNVMSDNLNGESANVLTDCITFGLLENYAANTEEETMNAIVNVVNDIIVGFGEAGSTLSDEQKEAEAVYLQTVLELALLSENDESTHVFMTAEEAAQRDREIGEGTNPDDIVSAAALDKTPEEFLNVIADSVVISDTVKNDTENVRIAVDGMMSNVEKQALADALGENVTLDDEMKAALVEAFALEEFMD